MKRREEEKSSSGNGVEIHCGECVVRYRWFRSSSIALFTADVVRYYELVITRESKTFGNQALYLY